MEYNREKFNVMVGEEAANNWCVQGYMYMDWGLGMDLCSQRAPEGHFEHKGWGIWQ